MSRTVKKGEIARKRRTLLVLWPAGFSKIGVMNEILELAGSPPVEVFDACARTDVWEE